MSGNVREVVYQKGAADEFHHKYHYDADNRITNVFTSADGIIYEQDAKYFYYDHGPLARVELGHEKVQAQDYAYTIQGWLKTVNGEQIDPQTMMGADGINSLNKQVARDVYGYSLNYFDGDYTSSNTSMLNHSVTAQTASMGQSLYNGNIRTMFTALSPTTLNQDNEVLNTHQTNYTYDQLNRIKSMTGYDRQVGQVATPSGYSSSYSYDPNGNLTDLQRWAKINDDDESTQIDQLVYHYNDPVNGGNNNRLSYVTDDSGEVLPGVDLASQSADNYSYDAIGQLIQDNAEHIEEIKWTVTGKVKEIFYDAEYLNKHIEFMYNPMGNRIGKVVTINSEITKTLYFLDASGNTMAIYTLKTEDSQKNLYLSERNIYGSSRLGMENVNYLIASTNAGDIEAYAPEKVVVGDKTFELSNHLGNVLATINDRKLYNELDGNYESVIKSFSDYYAFGMLMPNRQGGSHGRYLFNGMEHDGEVSGDGNSYTTEFRQYDPRLAKWKSLDALMHMFPHVSPYVAFANNPVYFTDIYGLAPDGGVDDGGDGGGDTFPENPTEGQEFARTTCSNGKEIIWQWKYENGLWEGQGGVGTLNEVDVTPGNKASYENAKASNKIDNFEYLRQYKMFDWCKYDPNCRDIRGTDEQRRALQIIDQSYQDAATGLDFAITASVVILFAPLAIETAPTWTPWVVNVARTYHTTIGVNGGYANAGLNYLQQVYVTDNWGLEDKSISSIILSGGLPYNATIMGQTAIGVSDRWLNVSYSSTLGGIHFGGYVGGTSTLSETMIYSGMSAFGPMYGRVPIFKSPFLNFMMGNFFMLPAEKATKESQNENK